MNSAAVSTPEETSSRGRRLSRGSLVYVISGITLGFLFLLPLAWAVFRSFQPARLIAATPTFARLNHLTLINYVQLIGGRVHILRYVGNSLIVATGTAGLTALLSTLAGYGFGRTRFWFGGAGIAFALIIVTLMVPFQAILTPLFMELDALQLTNTRIGLIIFHTTLGLPFGVFVMRNTFEHIPRELEDSAYVDGASVIGTLLRVLRPFILPGIATTVLYAFLRSWTEFLGALTFITDRDLLTLPVALLNVQTGTYGQVNYGYLSAGAVLAMIPCVILYVSLQRYYVRGLASGAIKG